MLICWYIRVTKSNLLLSCPVLLFLLFKKEEKVLAYFLYIGIRRHLWVNFRYHLNISLLGQVSWFLVMKTSPCDVSYQTQAQSGHFSFSSFPFETNQSQGFAAWRTLTLTPPDSYHVDRQSYQAPNCQGAGNGSHHWATTPPGGWFWWWQQSFFFFF